MKGNFHVQFLGEGVAATSPPYPTLGWATTQGHRIKIGKLGRMADPAFGENLSFCGTSSHLFTMFAFALVIINKYNIFVQLLVTIENLRKLRKK